MKHEDRSILLFKLYIACHLRPNTWHCPRPPPPPTTHTFELVVLPFEANV